MRFRESKNFSLTSISSEIQDFWSKNDVFSKSFNKKDSASFIFYEGPPSANGKPGIHHVMARTIKDAFCRYKTLKGYNVKRKAGWDTHGLPVELGVEKELGISKDDIGSKISVSEYNAACKKAGGFVVRGRNRHQLTLQVNRQFSDFNTSFSANALYIVDRSIASYSLFQIKQAPVDGWYLPPFVTQIRRPFRDVFKVVKRRLISGELSQK